MERYPVKELYTENLYTHSMTKTKSGGLPMSTLLRMNHHVGLNLSMSFQLQVLTVFC